MKNLKIRVAQLLSSNRNNLQEYGKACNEILERCLNHTGLVLSDKDLISQKAKEYAEKEKNVYSYSKKEEHLLHIKAASELFILDYASPEEVKEYLSQFGNLITFEEAKHHLKNTPLYEKVNVEIVEKALELLRS